MRMQSCIWENEIHVDILSYQKVENCYIDFG